MCKNFGKFYAAGVEIKIIEILEVGGVETFCCKITIIFFEKGGERKIMKKNLSIRSFTYFRV